MANLDPTANRMHVEAAENSAQTLQEIVDDVGDDAEGEHPADVAEELRDQWSDRYGEAVPDLPAETAEEIADHLVAGEDVTVVPPPRPEPPAD